MSSKWSKGSSGPAGDEVANLVAHSLRADGFDASEDGTGRGIPLVADPVCANEQRTYTHEGANNFRTRNVIAFDTTQITSPVNRSNPDDRSPQLAATAHPPSVAFDLRGREGGAQFEGPHDTANIRASDGGSSKSYVASWAVRRLTPTECERLQGFPDGYTAVPFRGKAAADGPRYKALGNSMAVNCMRWLGMRIAMVSGV